jgi:malonate transporter
MALVSLILPVFALIMIGLVARHGKLLEISTFRGLMDIVFFLSMPSLLFSSIVQGPAADLVGVASVYFVGCLTVFALGIVFGKLLKFPLARSAMLGLNASYGNTVLMGVPIIVAALGQEALPPLLAIVAFHSAILLPLAGVLVDMGHSGPRRPLDILTSTVTSTLKNPVIMSILIAFAWRALALPYPAPLKELLHLLGGSAVPMALICLGGSLPAPNAKGLGAETAIAAVLKLVVLPALVWSIGRWAELPTLPLTVAILTAGMPTGANAFLLARRSESLLEISAATVLVTTTLSLLTLYLLLSWLT